MNKDEVCPMTDRLKEYSRKFAAWTMLPASYLFYEPTAAAVGVYIHSDLPIERAQLVASEQTIDFNIMPQSLNGALLEFALQAGIQIFYDTQIPKDLQTGGIKGRLSPEEALQQLLAGSGLKYLFTSNKTVTIKPPDREEGALRNIEQSPVGKTDARGRLDTMIVEAAPLDTEVSDMAVRTLLLTEDDIANGAFRNALDVLQSVEGIYIPLGEGAKQSFPSVTVRGLGSGYFGRTTPLIFLLNGHNITGTWGAYFSFADLQLIPASMIQRVEIIKGPFSSIYGSGALGGVINIVTKQRFNERRDTYIELGTGSEEYSDYSARVSGRNNALNWALWASRSESDSREYFKEDWQQVYGEIGRGSMEMNRVGLSALVDLTGGDSLHVLLAHDNRHKNISDGRYYGDEQFITTVLQTKYTGTLSDGVNTEIYLSYNYSNNWEPTDFGNGIQVPLELSDPHYIASYNEYAPSEVWGMKSLFNIENGHHYLTPGIEYRHQRTWWANWAGDKAVLKGWTEGWQTIYSAFVEDTITLDRLIVTPSIRVDRWKTWADVSGPDSINLPWNGPGTLPGNTVSVLTGKLSSKNDKTSIDPKIRAAYHIEESLKLRGALGTTFRAPTALEIYNYDYATVQSYIANSNLRPERVTSLEVGIDSRTFGGRLMLSGTAYYTAARDRIEYAPDASIPNTKSFQNLDSNAYGLELAANTPLTQNLVLSLTGSLTRSEYDGGPFDGLDVPLIPEYKANATLNYRHGNVNAHIGADFIGQRTIVNDPGVAGTGFPTTVKDGAYILADASLRINYTLGNGSKAYIKLFGKNLLDDTYMVDGFFVYQEPFGLPNFAPIAQGRTYYLVAGLNF